MDQAGLQSRLHALTGDLRPGASSAAELHEMRRRLAASLRNTGKEYDGASEPPLATVNDSRLREQIEIAVAESAGEHIALGSRLFVIRRSETTISIRTANPFTEQVPTRTFGPFTGGLGQEVWFDEFLLGATLQVTWAGRTGIALVLPASSVASSFITTLQYNAASIWIAADLLTGGTPPSTFAGWRVKQATIRFSVAGKFDGTTITLPSNAILEVLFQPDNSEADTPPPGPGADAGATQIQRPFSADFVFNTGGAITIKADPASVTAFGITAAISPDGGPVSYDANLKRILFPCTFDSVDVPELDSRSTLCNLSGKGKIEAAAWSPTTVIAAPNQLATADSGGALVLVVSGTFNANITGIDGGPVQVGPSYIAADRGFVEWFAPGAVNPAARYTLSLWPGSTLRYTFDKPFPLIFFSTRFGQDMVEQSGTLDAALDQPKQADGSALRLHFQNTALFVLSQDATFLTAAGGISNLNPTGRIALALSNGLFTVSPAKQMFFNARLQSPQKSESGSLNLAFGVYQLLPMLPDPYAANFDTDFRVDAPRGRVALAAHWTGDGPTWIIDVDAGSTTGNPPAILPTPIPTPLSSAGAEGMKEAFYDLFYPPVIIRPFFVPLPSLRLLDLSTNSDQLGVNLSFGQALPKDTPPIVQVVGIDLVSLGGGVELLMLPQVQWEPVQVVPNTKVVPLPNQLSSRDDGGPTLIAAQTVRLTPIAPLPVATAVVDSYNLDSKMTGAFFTLPFGIRALAALDPTAQFNSLPPEMQLRRQTFEDSFIAATQIRLEASPAIPPVHTVPGRPPLLPGFATQFSQAGEIGTQPQDFVSVLTPLDRDFNLTFSQEAVAPQIPIERIDLSGYGASCFSNWFNRSGGTGITNVRFEVLNGRTRYEVLRMQSKLIPCDATVVRTITLERLASGAVYRWDSGWVAVTDGLFQWAKSDVRFNNGAALSFKNIREIRDSVGTITLGGASVEAVHFDADIAMDHVVRGATSGNLVPALNQLGFVQQIAFQAGNPLDVAPLNTVQLRELLGRFEPVGGNVDCVIDIGGSGQEMRITGVFSSPTKGVGNDFVVACYGSLIVPSSDQWTMIRSNAANDEITPVDARRGVPLVRLGGNANVPASGPYLIRDPQDLLNQDSDADAYGLQLTTRTNRLLFLNPAIIPGVSAITSKDAPIMADPFALVGTGGPFPSPNRCLHLTMPVPGYSLEILPGGYRLPMPAGPVSFTIPDLPDLRRFLVKSGGYDMRVDYAGTAVQIVADAGAPWSINIPQVPTFLDVHSPDFGEDILKLVSDLYSPDAENLKPPQIVYGEALKAASDIITALQGFTPADAPPLQIDLSPPRLDDPSLHLNIAANFPIANEDGSALDIGIGKFRGSIGFGTEINVGLSGFGGRIYFNLLGELQQPLLPKLLYVGGSLFLEISIDDSGTPGLRLIASAVASIGGDLIPGLIAVEGSASYGYLLDTSGHPFTPGVALGIEARARLLSGLVGVRFRADVTVGVTSVGPVVVPLPRPLLITGTFSAHLSVVAAWVFEKSFDKTLRFHQEIPALAAGVLEVYTGMVPLPV